MLYEKVDFKKNCPLKMAFVELQDYPFHMHADALELAYVMKGSVELHLVNEAMILEEGDIQICNYNELHRYRRISEQNSVVILFLNFADYRVKYPDIDSFLFTTRALTRDSREMQNLRLHLEKAILELCRDEEMDWRKNYSLGEEILRILVDGFQFYYIGEYNLKSTSIYKNNEVQLNRLRRTIDYIYRNYNNQIRVEDIALQENVSPYHLTAVLKNGCGMGFRMLLNMVRVEKSAALILEGNISLQNIAYECGFSKYKYFTESFQKFFGMSPAAFRDTYQKETRIHKAPQFHFLDTAEISVFLDRMAETEDAIVLDLSKITAQGFYKKAWGIYLTADSYEHITDFSKLKMLSKEIKISYIRMDSALSEKYKNSPRTLLQIEQDLQSLGVLICHFEDEIYPEWEVEEVNLNQMIMDEGIFLPSYYMAWLHGRLGEYQIRQGKGYVVTSSTLTSDLQILLMDTSGTNRERTLHLKNMNGTFVVKRFDYAEEMPQERFGKLLKAEGTLPDFTIETLNRMIGPDVDMKVIEGSGDYRVDFRLNPHETILITYEKL